MRAPEQVGADSEDDLVDEMEAAWLRERPGTDVGSIGVVTRLQLVTKLLQDDHRRLTAQIGVDAAVRDLLSSLRRAGAPYRLSSGELARRALVTTGAISQRIGRAEELGLVRRTTDPDDGRSVQVELTPAGHDLIEHTVDTIFAREQVLLSGLDDDERRLLAGLLRKLLGHLGNALEVEG
jgi:DNA-binding MarR family transcriptional regulator